MNLGGGLLAPHLLGRRMIVKCDSCEELVMFENGRCIICGWILDMNEDIEEYEDEERFIGIPYDDYI